MFSKLTALKNRIRRSEETPARPEVTAEEIMQIIQNAAAKNDCTLIEMKIK
jgi:hypothetical protein